MRARVLSRHRALRWAIPSGVVVAVGAVGFGMLATASANSALASVTAPQLLHDVENSHVAGLSGTINESVNLGLPALGLLGGSALTSLLSGSHSVRVWYGGATRQRVAVMDKDGETDVFHNGTDVWQWDSSTQTANHTTLPATQASTPPAAGVTGALTPSQLTQQVLTEVQATSTLTLGDEVHVADREAYQLVLTPTQAGSTIGSVHVSVDGQTKIPLGVQVYARSDTSNPVVDVAFSQIDLTVPDAANFTFTPPQSAKVQERSLTSSSAKISSVLASVKQIGTGWTSVLELPESAIVPAGSSALAATALGLLPAETGGWGSGHLLTSSVISALVTDDGRVYLGAVQPSVLYDAASK